MSKPIITFSDAVDSDGIAWVLGSLSGSLVLVTCSDDSQATGEIRYADTELHLQCYDNDDRPTTRVAISLDIIEEVTYL